MLVRGVSDKDDDDEDDVKACGGGAAPPSAPSSVVGVAVYESNGTSTFGLWVVHSLVLETWFPLVEKRKSFRYSCAEEPPARVPVDSG